MSKTLSEDSLTQLSPSNFGSNRNQASHGPQFGMFPPSGLSLGIFWYFLLPRQQENVTVLVDPAQI